MAEQQQFAANSTSDMQLREIQMLKNQLTQANLLIDQYQRTNQSLVVSAAKNPEQSQNLQDEYDRFKKASQSSNQAVPTTNAAVAWQASSNPAAWGMAGSNEGRAQWERKEPRRAGGSSALEGHWEPQAQSARYPRTRNAAPTGQMTQPADAENEDETIDWLSMKPRKSKAPATTGIAWASRQEDSQGTSQAPMSSSMKATQKQLASDAVRRATKGDPAKGAQLQNVENNLLQLNLDRDKYKAELDKIPENAKTIAQRRRREFLEQELKVVNKNISTMKQKLREMGELQTSYSQYP